MPRFYNIMKPSSNKAAAPGSEKKEDTAAGKSKKGQVPNEPPKNGKAEGGGA